MKKFLVVFFIMVLLLAVSSLGLAEKGDEKGEDTVLGMCYNGPIGDMGWIYGHDEARAKVVEKYPFVTSAVMALSAASPYRNTTPRN